MSVMIAVSCSERRPDKGDGTDAARGAAAAPAASLLNDPRGSRVALPCSSAAPEMKWRSN